MRFVGSPIVCPTNIPDSLRGEGILYYRQNFDNRRHLAVIKSVVETASELQYPFPYIPVLKPCSLLPPHSLPVVRLAN
jgi:hypothetical protein